MATKPKAVAAATKTPKAAVVATRAKVRIKTPKAVAAATKTPKAAVVAIRPKPRIKALRANAAKASAEVRSKTPILV